MNKYFIGHRDRLRKKFLKHPESLYDYELLELMLFLSIPRRDVKPIAKDLLGNFKNLKNVMNSTAEEFLSIPKTNKDGYVNVTLIKEIINRITQDNDDNTDEINLNSWSKLVNYLKTTIDTTIDQFRVIFLNKQNILITDKLIHEGLIDENIVDIQSIIKKIFFYNATAIIPIHNYLKGQIKVPRIDGKIARNFMKTCKLFNVAILDYVVIIKGNFLSLKSKSLLPNY